MNTFLECATENVESGGGIHFLTFVFFSLFCAFLVYGIVEVSEWINSAWEDGKQRNDHELYKFLSIYAPTIVFILIATITCFIAKF
jgi:hypothetical protein